MPKLSRVYCASGVFWTNLEATPNCAWTPTDRSGAAVRAACKASKQTRKESDLAERRDTIANIDHNEAKPHKCKRQAEMRLQKREAQLLHLLIEARYWLGIAKSQPHLRVSSSDVHGCVHIPSFNRPGAATREAYRGEGKDRHRQS